MEIAYGCEGHKRKRLRRVASLLEAARGSGNSSSTKEENSRSCVYQREPLLLQKTMIVSPEKKAEETADSEKEEEWYRDSRQVLIRRGYIYRPSLEHVVTRRLALAAMDDIKDEEDAYQEAEEKKSKEKKEKKEPKEKEKKKKKYEWRRLFGKQKAEDRRQAKREKRLDLTNNFAVFPFHIWKTFGVFFTVKSKNLFSI